MVVVCLRRVPCPRAEGGAYNSVGRRARAHNTFQALLCLEGSKAPIPSFPSSTFPVEAQGMDSGSMVLTYDPCLAFLCRSSSSLQTGSPRSDGSSRPSVRRSEKSGEQASHEPRSRGQSRKQCYGRPSGETEPIPQGSGEAESIPKLSGKAELALIPWARPSLALGGQARRSLSLSPWARRSWPLSLGRDQAWPSGVRQGGVYP